MFYFIHNWQQQFQKVVWATASITFLWNKLFSNSIDTTFTLSIFYFSSEFFTINSISLSFGLIEPFTVLNLLSVCAMCHLPFCFRISIFYPITVKRLKHMACHGSQASQISSFKTLLTQTVFSVVGNKAKGRISKRVFQEKARQIFRKTNLSYPLIRTRTYVYQGVSNVRFSENLACFVFLKHPFRDLPFCLITDGVSNEIRPELVISVLL